MLTGPPCAGKTTILDLLAALGYGATHEIAGRGLFDTFAYRRAYGKSILDYMRALPLPRYRAAFVLMPVPWQSDGIRYEDPAFQEKNLPLLVEAYREHGVQVIIVPVMPPQQRLAFILEKANATSAFSLVA